MDEDLFYVLMKVGWQYNDETYFRTENNDGSPEKVFLCANKAAKEVMELNLKEFKTLIKTGQIVEYGYSIDDLIEDYESTNEIFRKYISIDLYDWWKIAGGLQWKEDHPNQCPENMSNEQWLELMKCFNINFWEVVPTKRG